MYTVFTKIAFAFICVCWKHGFKFSLKVHFFLPTANSYSYHLKQAILFNYLIKLSPGGVGMHLIKEWPSSPGCVSIVLVSCVWDGRPQRYLLADTVMLGH